MKNDIENNNSPTEARDATAGDFSRPLCSPLRVAYSREEMEAKLKEWMVAEFGHPRDYITEPAAKERWYRDYGMMYHFLCDAFLVANDQAHKSQPHGN